MYYVYQLRRKDSEFPFYIGKGTGGRSKRHFTPSSLVAKSMKNSYIKQAIKDNVEVLVEVLWDNLTEDEAHRREVWSIAMWGRKDIGTGILTNHTDGGDGLSGFTMDPEIVKVRNAKISTSNTGNPKLKIVTKAKQEHYDKIKGVIPSGFTQMHGVSKPNAMKGKTYASLGLKHPGPQFKPGEHPESGKMPWESARVRNNPTHIKLWSMSQDIYERWSEDHCGSKALSKFFDLQPHATMNLIKRFKEGWVPLEDDSWCQFKKNQES